MKDLNFWSKKELSLLNRKLELQRSLAGLEAEAAALMLDGEAEDETATSTPRGSLDMVARVQAEIRAHEGAIRGCRVRRLDAIKAARATEAAGLREQVHERSKELKSIESKTGKLLAQLADLDGCAYRPEATPKSALLRAEIEQLERAALDIEQSDIPDAGMVDVDDVIENEQILLAVGNHPSNAPQIEEVSTLAGGMRGRGAEVSPQRFRRSPAARASRVERRRHRSQAIRRLLCRPREAATGRRVDLPANRRIPRGHRARREYPGRAVASGSASPQGWYRA